MRLSIPLSAALAIAACAPPPAPPEADEAVHYLFREFHAEDPAVLRAGVEVATELMLGFDLDGALDDRALSLAPLGEGDVGGVQRPDRPLDRLLGVAVAYRSRHSIEDHALLIVQEDQLPGQPTATYYDRTFPDVADPSCFPQRRCELLPTYNFMERSNPLYTVPTESHKEYRWVLLDAERELWAIADRNWFARSWQEPDGEAALLQAFGSEVFVPMEDGTTVRMEANWSESDIPNVYDDDLVRGVVKIGMQDSFEADDDYIDELLGR